MPVVSSSSVHIVREGCLSPDVDTGLESLIELRSRQAEQERVDREAEAVRERLRQERRRRLALGAAWYAYFLDLADKHARRAAEYEERAARLLEEGNAS